MRYTTRHGKADIAAMGVEELRQLSASALAAVELKNQEIQ